MDRNDMISELASELVNIAFDRACTENGYDALHEFLAPILVRYLDNVPEAVLRAEYKTLVGGWSMTVAELIDYLKQFNGDLMVVLEDHHFGEEGDFIALASIPGISQSC